MLHAKQKEIFQVFNSPDTKAVACAIGRQWGKSTLSKAIIINLLTKDKKKESNAYITPFYAQALKTFNELDYFCNKFNFNKVKKAGQLKIWNKYKSFTFLQTQNPVAIRGNSFDNILIDEAAFIKASTYQEVILPTQAAKPDGKVLLLSTPFGTNHFYEEFQRFKTLDGGYSFNLPSSDSPFISKDYLEFCRESLPDSSFRQEYLAEFVTNGLVFNTLSLIYDDDTPVYANDLVAGIDVGKDNDFTALAVYSPLLNRVVKSMRWRGNSYDSIAQSLAKELNGVKFVSVEKNGPGDAFSEILKKYTRLPISTVATTQQSKEAMIFRAKHLIDRGLRIGSNHTDLVEELRNFSIIYAGTTAKYSATSGKHDDLVMSMCIAMDTGAKKKTANLIVSSVR
jgi:hypothetical protein